MHWSTTGASEYVESQIFDARWSGFGFRTSSGFCVGSGLLRLYGEFFAELDKEYCCPQLELRLLATTAAISKDPLRQDVHYLLVFPDGTIFNNFQFSTSSIDVKKFHAEDVISHTVILCWNIGLVGMEDRTKITEKIEQKNHYIAAFAAWFIAEADTNIKLWF